MQFSVKMINWCNSVLRWLIADKIILKGWQLIIKKKPKTILNCRKTFYGKLRSLMTLPNVKVRIQL